MLQCLRIQGVLVVAGKTNGIIDGWCRPGGFAGYEDRRGGRNLFNMKVRVRIPSHPPRLFDGAKWA